MTTQTQSRKIWVGCLASYNSGIIFGEWLDLSDFYDREELQEKVNAIITASPYQGEEYYVADHEGFGSLLNDYCSIREIWAIHETLLQVEEKGIDTNLFLEFCECNGDTEFLSNEDNCLLGKFEDSYHGCFDSLEDYAQDLMENCGYTSQIPENLKWYIDFEKFGKDMERNGDIFTITTGWRQVHVFSNYY